MASGMEGNASSDLHEESSGSNVVGEEITAQSSPECILRLVSVKDSVPECTDPDVPSCSKYTLNRSMVDLTARLLFRAADECRLHRRYYISPEDMQRAINTIGEDFNDTIVEQGEQTVAAAAAADVQEQVPETVAAAAGPGRADEQNAAITTKVPPQQQHDGDGAAP